MQGEGADEKKAFASVNWVLTADELDLETQVALSFLDYLLTGTSASPLRKAITDSGLGESIVGGGMDDTLRQPTYSMGLKGVAPADVEKVQHREQSCACCATETVSKAVLRCRVLVCYNANFLSRCCVQQLQHVR